MKKIHFPSFELCQSKLYAVYYIFDFFILQVFYYASYQRADVDSNETVFYWVYYLSRGIRKTYSMECSYVAWCNINHRIWAAYKSVGVSDLVSRCLWCPQKRTSKRQQNSSVTWALLFEQTLWRTVDKM